LISTYNSTLSLKLTNDLIILMQSNADV